MNSEDKIYSKIKNASHKGEKDFPGMDKVWNRVEEKLENTIVVHKKNTWQKLAIAATVLLSFSIIYQFVSNEETFKGKIKSDDTNSGIVSNDSVKKIIDEAKEVVVDNSNTTKSGNKTNPNTISSETSAETSFYLDANKTSDVSIDDSAIKMEVRESNSVIEDKEILSNELNKNSSTENEISFRNSALNSSSSNNGYLAPTKKYEATAKPVQSKYKAAKSKSASAPVQQNKDLVVIDGVAMDKSYNAEKELNKISAEETAETTYLSNPLYIINGIEYTEESLFGKKPTSPYAPLDKQRITSTSILKPADATKIYGKKGKKGMVIITTKDGKPAEK